LHDARIDHGAAPGHPLDRLDELGDGGHAALQHIADPAPAGEQLHRLVDLRVRREHQDPDLGELVSDDARRLEPLGLVSRRHANVDDHQVGRAVTHPLEQLGRVAGLADDVEPGLLEQARESFAEQDVVVRQRYADGGRLHRIETIIRDARPASPR
jgi:hypothetical protein